MLKIVQSNSLEGLRNLIRAHNLRKEIISEKINYSKVKNLVTNGNFYYNLVANDKCIGLMFFIKHSPNLYLLDLAVLSEHRGKAAYKLAGLAKEKFFKNYPQAHVLTAISFNNKKALFFALRQGMKIVDKRNNKWYLEINDG